MSAASAAASGSSKKRKDNDGRAADDEAVLPSRLHGVTTGLEEGDLLVKAAATSVDTFSQITRTAKQLAEKEIEALSSEIKQLITANGGTIEPRRKDGRIRLNVGGTVMSIPVSALLHRKMKTTYLSTLLLHFTDQLPKDANQLPFLEMHPAYFKWLRDRLALLESPHLDEITIHSPEADDPSYAEHHSLFIEQKVGGEIEIEEQPQALASSAAAAASAAAGGGGAGQGDVEMADGNGKKDDGGDQGAGGDGGGMGVEEAFRQIDECMSSYRRVLEALRAKKRRMEGFLTAMRPFVKGDSSDEDIELMTLSVSDEDVSVLRRTIAPLGPAHALVKRFDPTQWPDQEAHQTSFRFLQLIVDFARRLAVMPAGRFVHPPVVAPAEKAIFAVELGMYGLSSIPPVPADSTIIKTADEWLAVMKMADKRIAVAPSLLYKSSRDTFTYASFLNKVTGKSGLLFALRDGDTHRFGCFIDGPLTPPDDPRRTNWYKVPVFFFSLSGAYETPTKIELPEDRQKVEVAGTQGAVRSIEGRMIANVCIGRSPPGVLCLGFGRRGPVADLSSCNQWMNINEDLSGGYTGERDEDGDGTLAQTIDFTCTEMEVWQVLSG
ncbi:unnamed protein product [Vitrella brassicaformis CCMP3155]|uniref:TLDc domain-containing protein n=1 Tax=Vitrella brassicaformis (strain CCMP3155) TaxID=1169540 RepID=A0A0G4EC58_VITBC|nr:unnamed protein product [Vitrella brassicaformis CCMP3155]|eukprot:CEL92916.1 unnamed protein product [Vitrella brassicaformis CCMP3155]